MQYMHNNNSVGLTLNMMDRLRIVALVVMLGLGSLALAEEVTLNLKEADIGAVVEMVSKQTGKNFVIDPRVKGKVTIISSHAMGQKELYQVFLSVLDVHGFAAIPAGEVIKIVPAANAKHAGGDVIKRGSGDEFVTRVLQVENVAATQLVPILRPLIPPQGHLAAHAQSNTLIISTQASNIAHMEAIISRIDQPSSGEIEIVPLQYASASEVVRVLDSLQQRNKADPQAAQVTMVADERTNSILLGGELSERITLRALITHLDTPAETLGNTHVVYLRYAKAKDLVPVLTGVAESQVKDAQGKAAAAPKNQGTFQIQADESTNALVITASPDVFRSLRSVINKLDIRRAQVLVEAIVAEISSNKAAELGAQWVVDGLSNGEAPVGIINFGDQSSSILGLAGSVASAAAGGVPSVPNFQGSLLGFGRYGDSGVNFASLIRALDGDGSTNILSTPSIVTMDNQEAEIVVGQEVPFITGSFTSTGGSSGSATNPFQTIDRKDVGITLKVLPQVNEGNSVKLDIDQSVNSLSAAATGAADIVTNKRSIKTSVLVDDGKMIVLGGLMKDDLIESEQKVPLLGDIPLLGILFRNKSTTKIKTNLMVFLKPTILRDMNDGIKVTESKYRLIRDQQLSLRERGVALMSDEETPLLDEPGEELQLIPEEQLQEGDKRDELDSNIFTHE